MNNYGWSGGVRDVGGSPTHAPATKIAPFSAPANRSEKRRKKTTTAKVGVWLASISIRFWKKDEANGFPVKVPYGGSVCNVFRQKILKVRDTFRRFGREAE